MPYPLSFAAGGLPCPFGMNRICSSAAGESNHEQDAAEVPCYAARHVRGRPLESRHASLCPPMTWSRWFVALLTVALPLVAGACAPPVGAVRVDPQVVQRELTGSVLTTGAPSRTTKNVMFLYG